MTFQKWTAPDFMLAAGNIALWNAAMSHAGTAIDLGESKARLVFQPQETAPDVPSLNKLFLDNELLGYLRVTSFPFQDACGTPLEVSEIDDLQESLATALTQGMLMTVLAALPADLRSRLRLGPTISLAALHDHAGSSNLQWFAAALQTPETGGAPVELTFAASPESLCKEIKGKSLTARLVNQGLAHHIATKADTLIGCAHLPLKDLHDLASGDCVLFTPLSGPGRRALLVENRLYLFGSGDEGWTCQRELDFETILTNAPPTHQPTQSPAENTPVTSSEPTGEEEAVEAPAPAPLEVTVAFSLGSQKIPLSEVESWRNGAVVALPDELNPDGASVTLTLNGTAFAEGDLVRIDNRLAVRLNKVLLHSQAQDG